MEEVYTKLLDASTKNKIKKKILQLDVQYKN